MQDKKILHLFIYAHRCTKRFAHKQKRPVSTTSLFCDLPGARTQDPHIKSVMLYQLS